MDKFPESIPGLSPPEKEEKETKDTKSTKTRKIGSFANLSLGKEAAEPKEAATTDEKKPSKFFERNNKDTEEDAPEVEAEATESREPTEVTAQKNEIIKQQLDTERVELEETIRTAEAGSTEHIEAITLRIFNERLGHKLEDPSAEADPEIDAELDRRRDELELILPEGPAPEDLPRFTEIDLSESADETIPISSTPVTGPPTPPVPARAAAGGEPPVPPDFVPRRFGGESEPVEPGPAEPSPDTETHTGRAQSVERPRESTGDVLLGGILGYLAKRKRDNARSEKAAREVSSLTKELESTKKHLAQSETALKHAAREKLQAQPTVQPERPSQERPKKIEITDILRQTASSEAEDLPPIEPLKKPDPDIMISPIEKPPQKHAEKPVEVLPPKDNPVSLERAIKRVKEMSTHDLVEAVDKLYIGGERVRTLYNSNKIDRNGLIKIVEQSLRGGSLQEVYEQVELGQERQRERAREFRHDPTSLDDSGDDSTKITRPKAVLPTVEQEPEIPNLPDKNTLQPVTTTVDNSSTKDSTVKDKDSQAEQKKSNITFTLILAIALALIVLWLIVKF